MKRKKQTTISYPFGAVDIYETYLISVINEGETVKPIYNDELTKLSQTIYKDRPFGYITHRKNSYGVDPKTYLETSKIKNLVAFAVVSKEELPISNAEIEKLFLSKPVRVFQSLEMAVEWVETLVSVN